jgi:hypothetical protein
MANSRSSNFNEEINNDYAEITAGESDSNWPCQQELIASSDEQVEDTQTEIRQPNLKDVARDSLKETPARHY